MSHDASNARQHPASSGDQPDQSTSPDDIRLDQLLASAHRQVGVAVENRLAGSTSRRPPFTSDGQNDHVAERVREIDDVEPAAAADHP